MSVCYDICPVNANNFDFNPIPPEEFVMTTRHEDETIEEVFWLPSTARHPNIPSIADAVLRTIERFGGIDILVNNASAISLTSTRRQGSKSPAQGPAAPRVR
jgi:hypothetical protein